MSDNTLAQNSVKLLDCTAALLRSDIRLLQFAIQHANILLDILERAKTADDLGPSIELVDAGAETFVETPEGHRRWIAGSIYRASE